jgi:nitrate reductase gamma subunit
MGMNFAVMAVLTLVLVAFAGVKMMGLQYLFGVLVPYAALALFFSGLIYRVLKWAGSPVPFRIPTTAGQQKSLEWIKHDKLDNPFTTKQTVVRMLLEVLLFRSLFRNTRVELREGPRIAYEWEKWLWLAGLLFHWTFFVIVIRHLRFFTQPMPFFVHWIENLDSILQVGLPTLYLSDAVFLAAVSYLFIRRVLNPQVRYISLAADYFPLLLIITIAVTGILMRYILRIDVTAIKQFAMGLVSFHPEIPKGIGVLFFIHLFLVSVLLAYFPFSKLMHAPGVFLSPTRNLPNNSRAVRHVNPWNYPVKVHTYAEYEDHFRDKMIEAGLPVEKE